MCVVIDANTFHKIINEHNDDFIPINNWIDTEHHKVIHGGSTFKEEISRCEGFRRYLRGLEKSGKTHELDFREVDGLEAQLKSHFKKSEYNDHHIAAILLASGCKLVCSDDGGFHKLIKKLISNEGKQIIERKMNIKKVNKVKIYQNKNHAWLLNDEELANCCV